MFSWMTADGYVAAADGNLDWVVPDDEQAKAAAKGLRLELLESKSLPSGDVMHRYIRNSS